MSSATVVSDPGPNALTIDPSSKYLYVANMGDGSAGPNGTVGQYNINPDGSLSVDQTKYRRWVDALLSGDPDVMGCPLSYVLDRARPAIEAVA